MDKAKRTERSVDSLQKIYAIVVALAVGQGIRTLLLDSQAGTLLKLSDVFARFPAFIALVLVVVPFYHGMNRHLDEAYIEAPDPKDGALLLDFFIFFLESAILFAAATSLANWLQAFTLLGGLLAVDIGWAVVSRLIHDRGRPSVPGRWALINLLAISVGIFVTTLGLWPEHVRGWLLCLIALLRTVCDYWFCRTFYFPR